MSKEYFVNKLNKETEEFMDFFMLKDVAIKVGSNKKLYLDVTLSDSTGEINGKKWDVVEEETERLNQLKAGDLVKIKATVSEWNGILQLRLSRIRKAQKEDKLELADYIKAAPEDPAEMYEFILGKARAIGDPELCAIACKYMEENKERLLYYPAAMRNHHAQLGGLLYHIKRMLMMGERACQVYTFLDPDWVICGVILHDMEKLNELESSELGVSSGYSFEGKMLGHLVMGVRQIEKACLALGIGDEKRTMLEHMVLSHHYEPEYGSPIKPIFPEAEMLHYLDMLDAKMFDFEAALSGTEGGQFTEKVRTLDNRMLYKATFKE